MASASLGDEDGNARSPPEINPDWSCCDHYFHVYRHLLARTHSASLADDLTQETMIQAMRRLDCFQGRGAIENWLLVIANNIFNRYLEQEKRLRRHVEMLSLQMPKSWEDTGAHEQLAEAIEDLRHEIAALPLFLRVPLEITAFQGYDYAEASAILGINRSTLRMRIYHAKQLLAKRLEKHKTLFRSKPNHNSH